MYSYLTIRYCTVFASLVAELDCEQLLHTYMYMYMTCIYSVSAGNDATCTGTGTSKSYNPHPGYTLLVLLLGVEFIVARLDSRRGHCPMPHGVRPALF